MNSRRNDHDGNPPSGYLSADYAAALAEFGKPLHLERSGGWILVRKIPDSAHLDAIGCYPLFACEDWVALRDDLDVLQEELITLAVVTDPFATVDAVSLASSFVDLVRPFKEHFIVDLRLPPKTSMSSHHQRNARKALRAVEVNVHTNAGPLLDEWVFLYDHLIQRHGIRGISRFSAESFCKQLQVPGLIALTASSAGRTVGMTLWYVDGARAYYHLGAYNDEGYDLRASFAIFPRAFEHFRALGVQQVNLGAGAGMGNITSDGLTRFKKGWATGTRTAFLCGRIFNNTVYEGLIRRSGSRSNDYFPAYRAGEFD